MAGLGTGRPGNLASVESDALGAMCAHGGGVGCGVLIGTIVPRGTIRLLCAVLLCRAGAEMFAKKCQKLVSQSASQQVSRSSGQRVGGGGLRTGHYDEGRVCVVFFTGRRDEFHR